MWVINLILIAGLYWFVMQINIERTEESERTLKYLGDIEKRLTRISEYTGELTNKVESLNHIADVDYKQIMGTVFKLSNEINRVGLRVARLEMKESPAINANDLKEFVQEKEKENASGNI